MVSKGFLMPKKLLSTAEFNSLNLPIKFCPKIDHACRYVFVDGLTLTKAANKCDIEVTIEIEELHAAIQIINRYII